MTGPTPRQLCPLMLARLHALEYIYRVASGHRARTVQEERTLNGRPCFFVRPAKVNPGERHITEVAPGCSVVLCVHGMSVYGHRDVRMLGVAHALASLGHTAVIPSYPEIQDLQIVPSSVDCIRSDIEALSNAAGRPIGLVSASFSGGLSLIAAAHRQTHASICSMLIVGSYCHVDTTMDFFLHGERIDPYGLFIMLKNFLPYAGEVDERLLQALDVAARDNGFHRTDRELEPFLAASPVTIREEFRRLLTDREYRLDIWNRILEVPAARQALDGLDVLRVIDGITGTLCLLHGVRDIVIPPEESVLLFDRVKRRIAASLTVTSIIDHGNVRMNWGVAGEFASLVNTMALFFRSLG